MDNIGKSTKMAKNKQQNWDGPQFHNKAQYVVVFVGASSKPSCDRLSIRTVTLPQRCYSGRPMYT